MVIMDVHNRKIAYSMSAGRKFFAGGKRSRGAAGVEWGGEWRKCILLSLLLVQSHVT